MAFLLILLIFGFTALVGGLLLSAVWNGFVLAHVAGTMHASLGACMALSLGVALLSLVVIMGQGSNR